MLGIAQDILRDWLFLLYLVVDERNKIGLYLALVGFNQNVHLNVESNEVTCIFHQINTFNHRLVNTRCSFFRWWYHLFNRPCGAGCLDWNVPPSKC